MEHDHTQQFSGFDSPDSFTSPWLGAKAQPGSSVNFGQRQQQCQMTLALRQQQAQAQQQQL